MLDWDQCFKAWFIISATVLYLKMSMILSWSGKAQLTGYTSNIIIGFINICIFSESTEYFNFSALLLRFLSTVFKIPKLR